MRILIAEDERDLNNILTERLRKEHYSVDACFDGQEAWDYLDGAEYDALILDIMMPVMDGLTLLKKIRSRGNPVPVLLLTAKDSIEDRVKGLDAGANDYLVKPFAFEELLARIRVMLRKPAGVPKTCYRVGDLEVHLDGNAAETGRCSKDLLPGRRSGSPSGYPRSIPGRKADQPFWQRIFSFAVYGTECGDRPLQGQAGTAYLEL